MDDYNYVSNTLLSFLISCCSKLVADCNCVVLGPFVCLMLEVFLAFARRENDPLTNCVFIHLISWSSSEGPVGEVHRRFEEGASGPGHQEGGVGAGPVARGVHCHGWCADLLGLSLRMSRRLVRAPAPQVGKPSQQENLKSLSLWVFCQSVALWLEKLSFSQTEVSQTRALSL